MELECGGHKGGWTIGLLQKGVTVGFYATENGRKSMNVDGVSITLGNPRKHVWTYATGFSDDGNFAGYNCHCAAVPGPDPPTFVGNHYYCEVGDTGEEYSGAAFLHIRSTVGWIWMSPFA